MVWKIFSTTVMWNVALWKVDFVVLSDLHPTTKGGMQKWKLSWNILYTLHTRFCMPMLINKTSASGAVRSLLRVSCWFWVCNAAHPLSVRSWDL